MSHFSVLVIGHNVEKQMAPYHEFECTGYDDEFVQDIDRTEEALAKWRSATVTRFRSPEGELHDPFDLQGNWKPEFSKQGNIRTEKNLPPGWAEVEVDALNHESALKWISSYYGWSVLGYGMPPQDEHRYGRIELDDNGGIARCIERTNPNKKWDWWQLGGRWQGFLILKPGAVGESGRLGLLGSSSRNGGVDSTTKGAVDFEAMRNAAGTRAGTEFDKVSGVIAGRDWVSWDDMRKQHPGDIEAARADYWNQPVLISVKDRNDLGWSLDLEDFRCTREEFVQRARDHAIMTYAFVKDGQWHERGSMGWFGMASNEMDKPAWARRFNELIDSLPDDTLLSVVDCHI